jgi:hypothetical protein
MTAHQFLDRYPEFETGGEVVDAALAEAAGEIDSATFGARYDEAHGALAAHKLWSSAFGVSLRLDGSGEGDASKYLTHYLLVRKAITAPLSMMVI